MLNPLTATTTTKALHVDAGPPASLADDQPRYAYAGEGRFLPDNQAAIEECRCFNAWVEEVNARARGGIAQ